MIRDAKEVVTDYYGCSIDELKQKETGSKKIRDMIDQYLSKPVPVEEVQFGVEEETSAITTKSTKRSGPKDLNKVRVKPIEKKEKPAILKQPKITNEI
jgi:hypothetical protein